MVVRFNNCPGAFMEERSQRPTMMSSPVTNAFGEGGVKTLSVVLATRRTSPVTGIGEFVAVLRFDAVVINVTVANAREVNSSVSAKR